MPRTSSAKKALRQNARRHAKNLVWKTRARDNIKEYRKLLGSKDSAGSRAALARVQQTLAKMAKVGLIKRGKVRRLTSRLSKKLASQ
ncbi:MAG: 30S ribosomal protein S20 [Candidatus Jorgensenbacteria bacterium]|nr:30S ribosomal protein S20 [Candidatus Jorgensenbacteria bacterium]